ncbi:MAG TPA: MoaD/ThiS family protein [Prosthecobacter sp.]|nr:MoaD/ThiS family protein [Prosthecobacter sp.]
MNVRVLFFSVLKDITDSGEVPWQCRTGETVMGLLTQLYDRWPRLRDWDSSLLVAIDQAYVKRDAALSDGCEVAVMPPVQGG